MHFTTPIHQSRERSLTELTDDDQAAHAWRCLTLRLLDPEDAVPDTIGADMKEAARASRESSAKLWAAGVVEEVANKLQLIPRVNLEDVKSELEAIAVDITELSWSLWTRKQLFEVWKWQDLKPEEDEYVELTYRPDAQSMKPHALHTAELTEDEDALNGNAAVLLCSPAVVAWGNADGGEYETEQVWRKAVVWFRASNESATGATKC